MKSNSDPRHEARKLAIANIFCWLFSEAGSEECLNLSRELFESENVDHEMASAIIAGVKKDNDAIDQIITKCAPEWPLDKISKIDLVILRVAIYEILYNKAVPTKVAIDEAVELAKEFGNDTSSKFVNGVLGNVVTTYLDSGNTDVAPENLPQEEKKD